MSNSQVYVNEVLRPIKRASFKPGTTKIIAASVVVVTCIFLVSAVLISSLTRQLQEAKEKLATQTKDNEPHYFSVIDRSKPTVRVFNFPENAIGTLADLDGKAEFFHDYDSSPNSPRQDDSHIKAQGQVTVHGFRPGCLKFNTLAALSDDPKLLERFRDDEIGSLNITRSWMLDGQPELKRASKQTTENHIIEAPGEDKILQYVHLLKSLKELDVGQTEVTDAGLEYVDQIKNLDDLTVAGTLVEGRKLAKLKRLPNLVKLDASTTDNIRQTLMALKGSTELNHLNVSWDDVHDEDLKTIATMVNLTKLQVRGTRITRDGLVFLQKLKHLEELDVRDCSLNPDCIPLLKRLPHVHLNVSDERWSKEAVSELKQSVGTFLLRK